MPYEAIDPARSVGTRIGPDRVAIGVYKKENARYGDFAITIGSEVLARLGWKSRERVNVLEGTGTDAGFMKLVRTTHGGLAVNPSGVSATTFQVRFCPDKLRHYRADIEPRPSVACEFQAFGGELLIMLPPWVAAKQHGE